MTAQVTTALMPDTEQQHATTPQPIAAGDPPPTTVTRRQVIDAMCGDPDIAARLGAVLTQTLAESTITMLEMVVDWLRVNNYDPYLMSEEQLEMPEYLVVDGMMPHRTDHATGTTIEIEPGSTADLVGRLVLDPARDEISLWHDQLLDDANSQYYCAWGIHVGVIRTS
ncbi:hypothetical protein KDA23_01795 [Candidatus Saccharibacteria bacterium]|nr:hypothetical protein [Candidatus Saccharibacteria bacterium]